MTWKNEQEQPQNSEDNVNIQVKNCLTVNHNYIFLNMPFHTLYKIIAADSI